MKPFFIVLKLTRHILGNAIYFIDLIFPPIRIRRSLQEQKRINYILNKHSLYQYKLCPFCVKVRRFLKKYNLDLRFKNPSKEPESRDQLLRLGGKVKVPCLCIEDNGKSKWLYESSEIIKYLKKKISL
ncbi:MAG: glutaredoxin [Rickettsiales bacterium]|nr:glutaredoxin [Rickettsiales bacterium]OUV53141.1 MAG: hypothetical protein CBC87_04520 [Rickettsiales bacterium TMED127]|tara:strand:+ start:6906 stop:7289 length:384 start_codon:yes stop_codon:yes gene_type:complete